MDKKYAKKLKEEKSARDEASCYKRMGDRLAWEKAQAKIQKIIMILFNLLLLITVVK